MRVIWLAHSGSNIAGVASCRKVQDGMGLTVGLGVMLQEVSGNAVDLHGQLARGRDHQRASAVARHEAGLVQQLYAGDQERQRLAGPCHRDATRSGPRRTPLNNPWRMFITTSLKCHNLALDGHGWPQCKWSG